MNLSIGLGINEMGSSLPALLGGLAPDNRPLDAALWIDLDKQEVFRDGSLRAFSDLTNVTGSQYNLDLDTGLDAANMSGYIEVTSPVTPTADLCPFTMSNGSSAVRFEFWSTGDGGTRTYDSGTASFHAATFDDGGGGNSEWRRYRCYFNYSVGVSPAVFNGYSESAAGPLAVAMPLMDQIGIGYNRQFAGFVYDGIVHKICLFQTPKTNAELLALVQTDRGRQGFNWLGDSWLNTGKIRHEFDALIAARGLYAFSAEDQLGSTSLADQAIRHAANTAMLNQNLIIMDGGRTTDDTSVSALTTIQGNHLNNNILVVEGNPIDATGTGNRANRDAEEAAIRTHMGEPYYVEILPALQAANDGSANDLADVANDIIPRSLLTDPDHINAAGDAIVAQVIDARVAQLGWIA